MISRICSNNSDANRSTIKQPILTLLWNPPFMRKGSPLKMINIAMEGIPIFSSYGDRGIAIKTWQLLNPKYQGIYVCTWFVDANLTSPCVRFLG